MIPPCDDCGAEAVVLCPGTVGEINPTLDFYTIRPERSRAYCLVHARAHGWPNLPGQMALPLRQTMRNLMP